MDRSSIITLINTVEEQDAFGIWQKTETQRDVYCQVDSVTRAEFFDGGRNGLNPEYRFTMFFADYEGEDVAEYNGKRYAIYRVYHARTDVIELYAERKGGTNK